jgi:hypothetical protein
MVETAGVGDRPELDPESRRSRQSAELMVLRALASTLDDLEKTRVMTTNRIGAAERAYGDALPHLHEVGSALASAERQAELMLRRVWRRHPLAPWASEIPGCGEKLIARLIAVIGEPSLRAVGHWARSDA